MPFNSMPSDLNHILPEQMEAARANGGDLAEFTDLQPCPLYNLIAASAPGRLPRLMANVSAALDKKVKQLL
ncbi:uncharacterized protein DSM5745_06888 [Aspergillus mulundensis]|uniref:Uncharacterized protein n=1 Tax=Aspergillus mulundensis TaxID=1810919 RepID=A0A3D8RSG8_9EURO|nr:hypothetical protein DSM5745_06888 [Aspergillus mulundensis]RDW76896.1 hypothetical protein DSM5745_06888 [Aspergillus mulundensis]